MRLAHVIGLVVMLLGCNDETPGFVFDAGFDPLADVSPDLASDALPDAPADTAGDPWTDSPTDAHEDTAADAQEDAGTWRSCALGCTTSTECCTTGTTCGTYPNTWSCDGICRGTGCSSDTECQTWATGLGLPGGSAYRCRGPAGGFMSCVQGCVTAADCCPSGVDCTAYPYRYLCDAGGCVMDGCSSDPECVAYAHSVSLERPDSYVCAAGMTGWSYCAPSCTTASDCCVSGSCTSYPTHWACPDGLCVATCDTDGECISYATSYSLPGAERYVCHTF